MRKQKGTRFIQEINYLNVNRLLPKKIYLRKIFCFILIAVQQIFLALHFS